jgi:type II secretory pathway pseudopilin PulG
MRTRKQQRGITLLEILASLGVMSLLAAGLTTITLSSVEDSKSQQAALYQSQLTRAIKNWLGNPANRNTVAATATTTTPVKVTTAQLAQWLPPGFGAANSYRQTPCMMVYYNAGADRIDAAITTEGGDAIDDAQLGYVVTHAGEGAGAVYALAPTVARGPYNSWATALANYTTAVATRRCSGTPATAGRLISLLSMDRNGTNVLGGAGEWLARNAIAGRPDLNRMNTSVDMNGNDVANARDLNATRWVASAGGVLANNDVMTVNGNLYAPNGNVAARDGFLTGLTLPTGRVARLSQGVYHSDVVPNGTPVNKQSCPSGSPQLHASAVSMSTNPPMPFFATSIIDVSGVGWQWRPMLYLYTQSGWIAGDPNYTSLNISIKCS